MIRQSILVLAIAVVVVLVNPVQAVPVVPGDFGPGAVMESFEGLSSATNIPAVGNGAFLQPGVDAPYTFPSGVTLTDPIPNSSEEGPRVGDFALGDASVTLLWNSIESASDVAFGTTYLISGGDFSNGFAEFTFPTDMLRVGAYLSGSNDQVQLSVFDSSGGLLETGFAFTGGGGVDFWRTNFVGFENTIGIRKMTIQGGPNMTLVVGPRHFLVDGLTFEVIPEPATIFLLGLGAAFLRKRH